MAVRSAIRSPRFVAKKCFGGRTLQLARRPKAGRTSEPFVIAPNRHLYLPCSHQLTNFRRLTPKTNCYREVEKSCYARRAATRPVLLRKPTNLEGAIIIPSTGEQRCKAATAACCSSLRGEKESIPLLPRLHQGTRQLTQKATATQDSKVRDQFNPGLALYFVSQICRQNPGLPHPDLPGVVRPFLTVLAGRNMS